MKIVGMAQIYNEIKNDNLKRCLDHYRKLCDEIVILDDASTDGSYDLACEYSNHVIRNDGNFWDKNFEAHNKALLLQNALTLNPDWIISFDADEIYERKMEDRKFLENVLKWSAAKEINSLSFNRYHLWLSECWYRTDKILPIVSPPRIWRNSGDLKIDIRPGLHQRLHPVQMENPYYLNITIVHYSSSSKQKLIDKILNRIRLDPSRDYLSVLNGAELGEINYAWFNDENRPEQEPKPDLDKAHNEIRKTVEEKRARIFKNAGSRPVQSYDGFMKK